MKIKAQLIWNLTILCIFQAGCQAKFLRVENEGELAKMEEYDQKIQVKALPVSPDVAQNISPQPIDSTVPTTLYPVPGVSPTPSPDSKIKKKKEKPKPTPSPVISAKASSVRQPELEDSEGFSGRRPVVDPFWIGEKVVLELSYFGATAGHMTMEVRPFVEVNNRKAYHFAATLKSSSFFSTFYSVDDYGETFMDYFDMIPFNFVVKVKESAQLREVRSFFDWQTMKASYWERKVTKKRGTEEKKLDWAFEPYAHNVFSAPFYLRTFALKVGKTIQYRVADENRNMVVKAEVLRKEEIKTEAGTFQTLVIKPEVAMEGVFKPMGDVFFWLTDDDRKLFVKIEAKIKIGTFKGEAIKIEPGIRAL